MIFFSKQDVKQLEILSQVFKNFHEGEDHFVPSHWRESLKRISHLSRYTDQIILVSGLHQIGETSFKQQLLEQFNENQLVHQLRLTPEITKQDILKQLTEAFQLDVSFEGTQYDDLNDKNNIQCCLRAFQSRNQSGVFIVDQIDQASPSLIEFITALGEASLDSHFHFVLFSNTESVESIQSLVQEDNLYHLNLGYLDCTEIKAYLTYHFKKAYPNAVLRLSEKMLLEIANQSQGIPGNIRTFLVENHFAPLKKQPFMRIAMLLIFLLFLYGYFSDLENKSVQEHAVLHPHLYSKDLNRNPGL